jgi:outer membrane protein
LRAARATISERRGAHYPNVNFIASRQKSDIGYENTQANKRMSTYYGVNVSIPIFSGGSSSAKVSEAYHMAEMAKSEHELVRREVVRRTRAAYLSANSSLKRIDAAKIAAQAATASSKAMKRGFELGTVTVIDVFDSLRQEFTAQRDLQQAKYAYIHAMLSLKKEAGSIAQADITLINSWLLTPSPL